MEEVLMACSYYWYWAARYSTWLLFGLMLESVVSFLLYSITTGGKQIHVIQETLCYMGCLPPVVIEQNRKEKKQHLPASN